MATPGAPQKQAYERGKEHAVWFEEAERVLRESSGKVLTEEQRRFYFDHGYLHLEGFLSAEWVARLQAVTAAAVERSRAVAPQEPSKEFMLEPTHTADAPRPVRLQSPVDVDEAFRMFTQEGPVLDVAMDLLGPNVRYHHSKMNFKWHSGGQAVDWHQDIQAWPHSNYSPLTIGVYLDDVDEVMGPLGVIPDSHLGPLYEENPAGAAKREAEVDFGRATYLSGSAGSVTVHNSRMIHGSQPNMHPTMGRNLLLQTYSAGNAIPLTQVGSSQPKVARWGSSYGRSGLYLGKLISGEEPKAIVFDPRPCPAVFLSEEQIAKPHRPSFLKDTPNKDGGSKL